MRGLTVLYDGSCALCKNARAWIERQASYVPLEFVSAASPEARERFPQLSSEELVTELCVVADDGRLWKGASAWVMCLWALPRYRRWAMRIAHPSRMAFARRFVVAVSQNRHRLSRMLTR